jgi:hypothetical protein
MVIVYRMVKAVQDTGVRTLGKVDPLLANALITALWIVASNQPERRYALVL